MIDTEAHTARPGRGLEARPVPAVLQLVDGGDEFVGVRHPEPRRHRDPDAPGRPRTRSPCPRRRPTPRAVGASRTVPTAAKSSRCAAMAAWCSRGTNTSMPRRWHTGRARTRRTRRGRGPRAPGRRCRRRPVRGSRRHRAWHGCPPDERCGLSPQLIHEEDVLRVRAVEPDAYARDHAGRLSGFAGTAQQAVPGQGGWRDTKPPYAKDRRGGGVGGDHTATGGQVSVTRVLRILARAAHRDVGPAARRDRYCPLVRTCVLVLMFGVRKGAGWSRGRESRTICWPSVICTSAIPRTAPSSSRCAPRPTTTGSSWPVTSPRPSPTSAGPWRRSPAASARSSGCRATTSCGPTPRRPSPLRGVARYEHLVALCRELGVTSPRRTPTPSGRAPAARWSIAPLFLLYDYSFLPEGCATKEEGLAYAHGTGIVCTDEHVLHPDPYPSREDWCRARVAETERRLAELPRRPAHGAGQPLPAGPAPHGRPALPRVRHVVRHRN